MGSLIPNYEYDIFISYRHNDNLNSGITQFVEELKKELAATIKDSVSIYFDSNAQDGLLENHHVDKSLEGKLKSLIFIPIISQTYCDPKSFAWQHEFVAFNKMAQQDQFGTDITLGNGNVASRILPVQIHKLDDDDKNSIEKEIGGVLRSIEFIYEETGVNRPLKKGDNEHKNINGTSYENQVNKVANAIKEIIASIKNPKSSKTAPKQPTTSFHEKGLKGKSKFMAIAATILIALAGYYFYPFGETRMVEEEVLDKSIAVLPFDNFMSDEDKDYFTDGLTEEILNVLAKTPDLKVASRTSSFQYKGKHEDVRIIAGELGVAHILEGSVRGSEGKLRITAQLIRASDGFHLWSQTYDKTKDDIIQIQEDIALKIAQALKTAMDPEALEEMIKSGTHSVEAYSHYLTGLSVYNNPEVYDDLEKARELDPEFDEAHFRAAEFWYVQLSPTDFETGTTGKNYEEKLVAFTERINLAIKYARPIDKIKYLAYKERVALRIRNGLQLLMDYEKERPNDLWATYQLVRFAIDLAEYELGNQYIRKMASVKLENAESYRRIVESFYRVDNSIDGIPFTKKAVEAFPHNGYLLYQAHRAYLWYGLIDEARNLVPEIMRSNILKSSKEIVKLRQACADGDVERANEIYNIQFELLSIFSNEQWLSLMLLNRKEEATALIKTFYDRNELYSVSSWLVYNYFDVTPFPKIEEILKREEAKPRRLIEIPFAIKSTDK